jgi:hypothetical protein
MRRSYQLSKIGKEKRKSGSFRLCGPKRPSGDSGDVTVFQANRPVLDPLKTTSGPFSNPRSRVQSASMMCGETGRTMVKASTCSAEQTTGLACPASSAIKKLPQVGQEPVEAVESGHSNPDRPMIIDCRTRSKDIPAKIPIIFGGSIASRTPHFDNFRSWIGPTEWQFGGFSALTNS